MAIANIDIEPIDIDHIVTEDDAPADTFLSEKQQRLLAKTLYTSWKPDRPFVVGVDIGIFQSPHILPIVPDAFVSLDIKIADDWYAKRNRSYFIWEFGKAPEVVIEVVSNKNGGELGRKLNRYAQIGCWYYVVFDPEHHLSEDTLRVYGLIMGRYELQSDLFLDRIGLGVKLWNGAYEDHAACYVRWTDSLGNLLPTDEDAIQHAENKAQRAGDEAKRQAEKAEKLAAKLRELGIDPDSI